MNWAHAHLIVNHLPVLGVPFGLALLAWGMVRRSPEIERTSLLVFVLTALASGAVYLTGTQAEDAVEQIAGVSPVAVGSHEDAALWALLSAAVLAVAALSGLVLFRKRPSPPCGFLLAVLLLATLTAGMFAWTANLGGKIRHPEAFAAAPDRTKESG